MGIRIVPQQAFEAFEMINKAVADGVLAEGSIAKDLVPAAAINTFDVFGETKPTTKFTGLAVNSCGSGLFILLKHFQRLGAKKCIIQSNTMYCVKTIVTLAGLVPVVIPSDPDTMIMDVAELQDSLGVNSKLDTVVLVSHIGGGFHATMEHLYRACVAYDVPMIEDMAHALGNGVAPISDAGVFSMYATKAIPAGEGGIIVTRRPEIQEFAERFVVYDRHAMEYSEGLNLRVSEVQAAFMVAGINHSLQTVQSRLRTHDAIKGVLEEFGVDHLPDQGITNGYKLIITDMRVLSNEKLMAALQAISTSGTVFGYSLSENIDPLPHYCFDTNYGHGEDYISSVVQALAEAFEEHHVVS
jgi:dTDP-4-amino-4,6-dideoxygalactose transaminase